MSQAERRCHFACCRFEVSNEIERQLKCNRISNQENLTPIILWQAHIKTRVRALLLEYSVILLHNRQSVGAHRSVQEIEQGEASEMAAFPASSSIDD